MPTDLEPDAAAVEPVAQVIRATCLGGSYSAAAKSVANPDGWVPCLRVREYRITTQRQAISFPACECGNGTWREEVVAIELPPPELTPEPATEPPVEPAPEPAPAEAPPEPAPEGA